MGVMLLLAGIILGVHYAAQRIWYTNALKDAYRFEEEKLRGKTKDKSEVPELLRPRAADIPDLQTPNPPEAAS
jgi:hypothetical protein